MALMDSLKSRMRQLKAEAAASAAAGREGVLVEARDPVELAKGCPGVRSEVGFGGVNYTVRLGTWFGWFWLIFTTTHGYFMFMGALGGKLKMNGQLVSHPSVWAFLGLSLFYIPFFLVGFAFTIARYKVMLTPDEVTVRWRILPFVGWTWKLAAGQQVAVRLAFRGSSSNNKPVDAIVVQSQGKEINFAAFLDEKRKTYLAAVIHDYYSEAAQSEGRADFIT